MLANNSGVAQVLPELPEEVWQHIVARFTLAHHIGRAAPTCKAVSVAARNAIRVRGFSGEVVTLDGHTGRVMSVAATPGGRIITGSYDKTVKVWRDGACERTVQHAGWVRAVAVLPGGARFVTGSEQSEDDDAKLWTLDGALERTFEANGYVDCVAALPDGVHFAIGLGGEGNHEGEIWLYHVDGTLVHAFEGHTDGVRLETEMEVNAVAVTPDGQHIISGSMDYTVKVWSVASKSLVSTCEGHTGTVYAVAAMPDGQRFLSGAEDRTVAVWLLGGTCKTTIPQLHTAAVTALVALPDNQHALSGSLDTTVTLFNVNDDAVLRRFAHHNDYVHCLALLPDGRRFVSGGFDGTVQIVEHGLAPL